jgi:hypothetical protein
MEDEMNEALLRELSEKLHGRFKLTSLVQKRLIDLMRMHSPVITQNSGGRPIRTVVEEIAGGKLQLVSSDDTSEVIAALPEGETVQIPSASDAAPGD